MQCGASVGRFSAVLFLMARITAIEPQKRYPDRVNIQLDGEFAFGLTSFVAARLKIGQELNEQQVASLQADEAREQAYQQALLFLSFRPRSVTEIRRNLQKHDIPAEVINVTLERLRTAKLADDNQFARAWVENRAAFRPRGRRALEAELRLKGLSDEATRSALNGLDEEALAYEAGLKKVRRLEALPWKEFRTKLSEFLARRGFPYSVISPVVSRIWSETHSDPPTSDDEEIA